MAALICFLLMPAALLVWSGPATAKEIRGAPKELVETSGTKTPFSAFGTNTAECRSFHRKGGEKIILIGRFEGHDYYSDCGGKFCQNTVLSHHRIPSGFSLKLRYTGSNGSFDWTRNIVRQSGNLYKFIDGDTTITLQRCVQKDIVAGLGRAVQDDPAEEDKIYSEFYARAVPSLCRNLTINSRRTSFFYTPVHMETTAQAERDAKRDYEDLPNFCRDVLGAFGNKGRVIPELLRARGKNG